MTTLHELSSQLPSGLGQAQLSYKVDIRMLLFLPVPDLPSRALLYLAISHVVRHRATGDKRF